MAGEIQKGTLVLMVTKGLSRTAVLCSKFTVAVLLWTASYAVWYGSTYGYYGFNFWEMEGIRTIWWLRFWGYGCSGYCCWPLTFWGSVISKSSLFESFIYRNNGRCDVSAEYRTENPGIQSDTSRIRAVRIDYGDPQTFGIFPGTFWRRECCC